MCDCDDTMCENAGVEDNDGEGGITGISHDIEDDVNGEEEDSEEEE